MATIVSQTYTSSLNVSVTTRDGVPSRITMWVTGDDASRTQVVHDSTPPRQR